MNGTSSTSKNNDPLIKKRNVDPKTGLDFSIDPSTVLNLRGATGSRYTTVDPTKYAKYFDDKVHTEFGTEYLDPIRASRQTVGAQTGAALLQSGAEIAGGTLEGLGYLGDVPQTINAIKGTEQEWGNWLSDIGKSLKTWSHEVAPIYMNPDDIGKFRPNKFSWWATNAPSMASTLSLLVPAAGTVKGISMLGKLTGIGQELGQMSKIGGTILGQAISSRLMENGMEASQAFDAMVNEQLALGVDYSTATSNAGIQASDLWNKEWFLLSQDILSYGVLMGTTKAAQKAFTKKTAEMLAEPTKGIITRSGLSLMGDAISEGGEEVFQYVLSDRASKLARAALDKDYSYDPSFKEYVQDQELWNSFVLGALGSGLFQTAGRKINNAINKKLGKETEEDRRISTYLSWSPEIKNAQDAVLAARARGDKNTQDVAIKELATVLAGRAVQVGDAETLVNTLTQMHDDSINEEAAKNLKISPEQQQFIKENYEPIIAVINDVVTNFKTYAKKYSPDIASRLATNDVKRKDLESRIVETTKQINEFQEKIPNIKLLSGPGQIITFKESTKRAVAKTIKEYNKQLKEDQSLTSSDKSFINKTIKLLENDVKKLDKEIQDQKNIRTPEEAEKDKALNLKSAVLDSYYELLDKLQNAERTKNLLEHVDEQFRKVNSKRKKEKRNTSRKVEPNLEDTQLSTDNLEQPQDVPDEQINVDDNTLTEAEQSIDYEDSLSSRKITPEDEEKSRKLTEQLNKEKKEKEVIPKATPSASKEEVKPSLKDKQLDNVVTGEKVSLEPERSNEVEKPTKDESFINLADDIEQTDVVEVSTDFDELAEGTSYLNLYVPKNVDSDLRSFLDNPKKKLGYYEVVFDVDLGEFFDKEFKDETTSIKKRIESGDLTLLEAEALYTSIVDRIPLRGKIRSKATGKEIKGDIYIYRTATVPEKAGDFTRDIIQKNTRALRQKVLEGLLTGKEVTISNLKRSAGVPNIVENRKVKVGPGLNVDIRTVPMGFGGPGGVIYDISGVPERRTLPGHHNSNGGGLYVYVKGLDGKPHPIRLLPTKVSLEDARIIFDLFYQAYKNKGVFKVQATHPEVSDSLTIGAALNLLVYNGKANTLQDPKSIRYREELINKQLYLDSNFGILHYGDKTINLETYTESDMKDFLTHINLNMNYPIDAKRLSNKIKFPFKVGSMKVSEKDIKAGLTYKELILKDQYVTTDVQLTQQNSTHINSDLFIEASDIDTVNFNDISAVEPKSTYGEGLLETGVAEDKIDMTDEEVRRMLDEIQGIDGGREFKGGVNFVSGNMQEELDYIKSNLIGKGIDTKLVDDFIKVIDKFGNTRQLFGRFKENIIYLYDKAEIGTGYHEAFHAIFRMYTTPEQQETILNEASKKYNIQRSYDKKVKGFWDNKEVISADSDLETGSGTVIYRSTFDGKTLEFTDIFELQQILSPYIPTEEDKQAGSLEDTFDWDSWSAVDKNIYDTLTNDRQLEEHLAEEFRNYMLTEGKIQPKPGAIRKFFRDLFNFIKSLFIDPITSVSDMDINGLFERISNGNYKYAKPTKEALANINKNDYYRAFSDITGFTATQIHSLTKQLLYQTVRTNDIRSLEDIKNLSFESVKDWLNSQLTERLTPKVRASRPEFENLYQIFTAVNDNFDSFKSLVEDMLMTLNIHKVEDFEEGKKNDFEQHTKAAYEYSSRDNMRANIKLFIATIPSNETDSFTNMATIVDFDEAWRKLSKELYKANNPEEMMEILKTKAQTDRFYKTVLKGNNNRFGLENASDTFKTQFWQTFKKHKHKFVKVLFNKKTKQYTYQDAELLSLSAALKDTWAIKFSLDSGIINPTTTKINSDLVKKIIKNYSDLENLFKKEYGKLSNNSEFPKLDLYLKHIVGLLNDIGITISIEQMKSILADTKLPVGDALDAVFKKDLKFLFDPRVGFLGTLLHTEVGKTLQDVVNLFLKSNIITRFAGKVADTSEDNIASTVLGPNNNQYYSYSSNNYLTDFLNMLNRDPDYSTNLSKVAGHNRSFFLDQLKSGAKIDFTTLLGVSENSRTQDYFDLEEGDDYLLKAVSILNGRYVLPTISDKKTYGWLEGFNKIDFTEEASIGQDGKYNYPKEVYRLFAGYYQNEKERIAKATADIIHAEQNNDYSALIENFHYQELDENNKPILRDVDNNFTGNGTKHILFAGYEEGVSDKEIRQILNSVVEKEIKSAIEHGIIQGKINEDGSIDYKRGLTNVRLPIHFMNNSKKAFKQSTLAVYNLVSDYAINHVIGVVETGIMLSGDPAYYKVLPNTVSPFEDITKRLAELTSPGDNLRVGFSEDEYDAGVADGDSYSVAVLNSYIFNSEELYKDLEKAFKESLKEKLGDSISEIMLDTLVANKLKAYTKVDATDGQAYISPRMYRQVQIRLGEWSPEKNSAYNRLMSNEDISLAKASEDIKVLMQPLKLMHYGTYFKNGLYVPIYDKMSTAVLLPQMVNVKDEKGEYQNAKLKALYDRMMDESNPLDMVKFDSATKVGNTTRPDYLNKENNVNETWEENLNVQHQSYKYLRRQVITDPHEDDRRLVGTQVKKIILQNLNLIDKVYSLNGKKVTGYDIATMVSKLYSAISNRGAKKLKAELKINKNGKADPTALRNLLKRAALQSNMAYNIIEALEDNNIELDTLPDRGWTESRLISKIGKKTVDLIAAGDSFIQMSAYGLTDITTREASELKLMDSEGRTEVKLSVGLFKDVIPDYDKISFDEKRTWLKENFEGIGYRIPTQSMGSVIPFVVKDFLPEETGNVILLPLEFTALTGSDFDIDKLFLIRYSYYHDVYGNPVKYEFIEGDEDDIVKDDESLLKIYQQVFAEQSRAIEELKQIQKGIANNDPKYTLSYIHGLLYKHLSSAQLYEIRDLMMEAEDIREGDILLIIENYKDTVKTFEDFVEKNRGKKSYDLNHAKALENRIVDLMKSTLTSKEHIVDTKTSIDAHTMLLKDILEEIDGLRGKDTGYKGFDWYGLSSQSKSKLYYIGGKFGIGPFALHNVHHALTQISNVNLKTTLNPFEHKGAEDLEYGKGNLARIYDKNGNVITDWLSALINAHVDIAKDPYIFRLNVNKDTYSAVAYLLRLGFGDNTFLFINQPAIVELKSPDKQASIKQYNKYLTKAKKLAVQEGKEIEQVEALASYWSSPRNAFKNSGLLASQLKKDKKKDSLWYATQAGIVQAYSKINYEADKLNKLVQVSRIDGKGYGTNLSQIRLFDRNIQQILDDKQFQNADRMFKETFIQTLKENSIDLIQKLYSNLTITSTQKFSDMVNAMVQMSTVSNTHNNTMWVYQTQKLSKELFTAFVSNYFTAPNGRSIDQDTLREMLYGNNSIAKQVNDIKTSDSEYKDNFLLKHLIPVHSADTDFWVLYTRSDVSNDSWTKNTLTSAWQELLSSPDSNIKKLAYSLIDYSFFMSGFNKTLFSFYHHIPIDALTENPGIMNESISYNDFLKDLKKELTKDDSIYDKYYTNIRDVFANNDEFVPTQQQLQASQEVLLRAKQIDSKVTPPPVLFTIKMNSDLKLTPQGELVTVPFMKVTSGAVEYLVEYVGYLDKSRNELDQMSFVYKVIPKKGLDDRGHTLKEYSLGEKSLIKKNNPLIFIPDAIEEDYIKEKVKDIIYVPQSDRLASYTQAIEEASLDLSDRAKDFLRGSISPLKMDSSNIELINKGLKTATSRTNELKTGLYRLSPDTLINITKATYYENISEMFNQDNWAIAEGFKSIDDMKENAKFKHTKDFLDGKRGLYVYDFELVEKVKLDTPSAIDGVDQYPTDSYGTELDLETQSAIYFNNMEMEETTRDDYNNYSSELENENINLLNMVRNNYGDVEAQKLKALLDAYNESEIAKKVVDKLKECLG